MSISFYYAWVYRAKPLIYLIITVGNNIQRRRSIMSAVNRWYAVGAAEAAELLFRGVS